jgi:biotin carboxylase
VLKGKKLLVLGANAETADLVKAAGEMGVTTIVTDYDLQAPAKKVCDINYNIDAMDVEALYTMAVKEKVDGVLVGVADPLVAPYQKLCSRLGLPCYGNKETVNAFTNKRHFKETCKRFGINGVPEYSADNKVAIKFPVVVKPADSNSGKGITICRSLEELDSCIERAKKESRTETVLIERYMECDDLSIYYTIVDGKVYLSSLSDRYTLRTHTSYTPICVGELFVSKYHDEFVKNEHPKYVRMFNELGLKNGVLYIGAFCEDGHYYVYDPGFRLQGGGFHLVLNYLNGFDQRKMLVHFALTGSMDCVETTGGNFEAKNDAKMHGKSAAVVWFLLKSGRIDQIKGLDFVKSHPSVHFVIDRFNVGDEVSPDMLGTERQVFLRVFMHCQSKAELTAILKEFERNLAVTDQRGENLILPSLLSVIPAD